MYNIYIEENNASQSCTYFALITFSHFVQSSMEAFLFIYDKFGINGNYIKYGTGSNLS